MKIIVEILSQNDGKLITVEEKVSDNPLLLPYTLLKLRKGIGKYANENYKIAKFKTDNVMLLAGVSERFPHVSCELIPDKDEVIEPEGKGLNPT
ncbi:MAG: hypothetical protein ACPLY9_02010 [Nitrososphaerales archaeon]